jgi:hypothetical protein
MKVLALFLLLIPVAANAQRTYTPKQPTGEFKEKAVVVENRIHENPNNHYCQRTLKIGPAMYLIADKTCDTRLQPEYECPARITGEKISLNIDRVQQLDVKILKTSPEPWKLGPLTK